MRCMSQDTSGRFTFQTTRKTGCERTMLDIATQADGDESNTAILLAANRGSKRIENAGSMHDNRTYATVTSLAHAAAASSTGPAVAATEPITQAYIFGCRGSKIGRKPSAKQQRQDTTPNCINSYSNLRDQPQVDNQATQWLQPTLQSPPVTASRKYHRTRLSHLHRRLHGIV